MATKAEIAKKVLRKLKVLSFGQTPPVEDSDIVEAVYDELHADLTEDNIITWGSTDDIPDEAVRAIVTGIELALEYEFDILGTGEMGIGNTTPSSAVASVLTGALKLLITYDWAAKWKITSGFIPLIRSQQDFESRSSQ